MGTKPYACDAPGFDKAFFTNAGLHSHKKTHGYKPRPYKAHMGGYSVVHGSNADGEVPRLPTPTSPVPSFDQNLPMLTVAETPQYTQTQVKTSDIPGPANAVSQANSSLAPAQNDNHSREDVHKPAQTSVDNTAFAAQGGDKLAQIQVVPSFFNNGLRGKQLWHA